MKDRPSASKTGTTDNYRDTWTDGYTPNLAIVVWVGNTDGHPMNQALSTMTAGKIWPQAMQESFDALGRPPEDFPRPAGLVEGQVCGDTAMRPGEPPCRTDLFIQGQQVPTPVPPTAQPTMVATPAPGATPPPEPTPAEQPTPPPAPTAAPAATAPAATAPAATAPAATAPPAAKPTAPPAPTAPPKPQPTQPPAATPRPKPTAPAP